MNKTKITVTLDPELKEKADIVLKEQDKKLSTVLNSLLRKYLNKQEEIIKKEGEIQVQ